MAGCKSNQGKFCIQFDHVALLSAPADILLARLAARNNNPYGKRQDEQELILKYVAEVEPLLRTNATVEINASQPLAAVVQQLEDLS